MNTTQKNVRDAVVADAISRLRQEIKPGVSKTSEEQEPSCICSSVDPQNFCHTCPKHSKYAQVLNFDLSKEGSRVFPSPPIWMGGFRRTKF